MGIRKGCEPRKDVLKGDLDDAIFAADFGNLISGKAPKVYRDARTFFQNTHPAKQLCKVVETVFGRLSDTREAGATLRLSTGFGGGKTHTLMALWHIAKNIDDSSLGTELLPAAGRPGSVTVVALDAGKAGVPEFDSHGTTKVRSLHGEIFYLLGGASALKALGKADDPQASPSEAQIEKVFPKGPVLLLLDELVIYMAKLSEQGQGNLLGFLNSLASVISKRHQAVLIVTDPAKQVAYLPQASALGQSLAQAVAKLDDMLDRKVSDFDPIGNEGAQIIVRRLFESIDHTAAQNASRLYHELYDRVTQEHPGTLPVSAASAVYAKRIVECYPFHPRLLETVESRLGAMPDFQKSRGVLRLFARILRDVWESDEDYELISAGEINWASPRIQGDLLQRLHRQEFKAAVQADVIHHAGELDGDAPQGIHRRVASALLVESLPLQGNSGLDPTDLTLAVLRPSEAGQEPAEALDRLVGLCWHTYPMVGGRGWQFRYEPNIIKQVEERMSKVPLEDARSRIQNEVQGYFTGPAFKLASWPETPRQVDESASLQLVLCEDEKQAKAICGLSPDSAPDKPIPRKFQNAIVAVTATPSSLSRAVSEARRLMAAEQIEREHQGETGKLVRDQLKRVKPEYVKRFRLQACRAFDRAVFAGGTAYTLDEQYQVPDEQVMQKAHGQACLRRFLDDKSLIYQPGDALDVQRFLKDVLRGAVPLTDNPDVYTAKAVHERFLSAPGLRLILESGVVRQTILKAVEAGKIAVRLADGRAYDKQGCVEGPSNARRRINLSLTSFALDDTVQVTVTGSKAAEEWLKVVEIGKGPTKPGGGPEVPKPPEAARVEATDWEKIFEYASKRPLLRLILVAQTPAAATSLATLAQPLGAEDLNLEVTVSGDLKGGGSANFQITNVGLNHPTKPLNIGGVLFNALNPGGQFSVELTLDFGADGRTGLEDRLRAAADSAPEEVSPRATFGKPIGVTK